MTCTLPFMRGGAATMAPLGIGIVAGVLLLAILASIIRTRQRPPHKQGSA